VNTPALSAPTVTEFLRFWLRDVVPMTVRPTTAASYATIVENRLIPALGSVRLCRLSPEHIQSHLAAERRCGRAASTIRQSLRILRIALERARAFGWVDDNAARRVATPRVERSAIVPLAPADVRALLRAAKGRPVEQVVTLGLTGLRAGEVRGLRWNDIDLVRRLVHIRQTAQWSGHGLEISPPKTLGSVRTIKLPVFAFDPLRRTPPKERHGFVFKSRRARGAPLHGTTLSSWIAEAAAGAGLPHVTIHLLRHTAAAMLLESGVHLRVVMNVLGHSRVQTTIDLYGHLRPELHADAARAMDRWVRRQR
jgi:integrase